PALQARESMHQQAVRPLLPPSTPLGITLAESRGGEHSHTIAPRTGPPCPPLHRHSSVSTAVCWGRSAPQSPLFRHPKGERARGIERPGGEFSVKLELVVLVRV